MCGDGYSKGKEGRVKGTAVPGGTYVIFSSVLYGSVSNVVADMFIGVSDIVRSLKCYSVC